MAATDDYKVYDNLATSMMQEYLKQSNKSNYVFSPYSVLMVLAMATKSTESETRREIIDMLLPGCSAGELEAEVKKYMRLFSSEKRLITANAALINRDKLSEVSKAFQKELQKTYGGHVLFSEDIVSDLNAWVDKATKGMIRKIADDSMKEMMFALMNAVYFEAKWKIKYDADDIREELEFHNADGSISYVTMLSSTEYGYIENEYFEGFVKPYKGECSFVGLLPKKEDDVFLSRALESIDLSDLVKNRQQRKLSVMIPEFSCESSMDLSDMLKNLGVNLAFQRGADFSPVSPKDIKMDCIKHKARIEVDRNGTKAAAVTMAILVGGVIPELPKQITLNRPFVYAVVHNKTGLPIFEGVVRSLADDTIRQRE